MINCADKVNGAPQNYAQQAQYPSVQYGVPNAPLTRDQHGVGWEGSGNMFYLLCSDCDIGGRRKK